MTTAIKYGIGFGLATCAWTLAEYALGFHTTRLAAGQVTSYLALVLPLTFIVLAGLAEKRRLGGSISFGRVLGVALVVMLVGDVITTPFLWLYHHFILPDWLERLVSFEREKLLLQGMSPAEIDRRLAALKMGNSTMAQIVGGAIGSTVVGLLIGVPLGLILRRGSNRPPSFGTQPRVAV